MPIQKSEFSCPYCKQQVGPDGKPKLTQIQANEGRLVCPADPAHHWIDTQAFIDCRPTMDFKPEMLKPFPQLNHGPLTITIPNTVKAEIENRFGDKLSATITGVLRQMLEGDVMMIPDTDVERIRTFMGVSRPVNSGELVGMIFSKMQDFDTLKLERDQAVANAAAYQGFSPGRVVVNLADDMTTIAQKAAEENMPVSFWVEKTFLNALRSNWF